MNIKILAQNIVNNPSDFTTEQIEKYFEDYAKLRLSDVSDSKSYSEEEVYKILLNYQSNYPYANNAIGLKKWFEQFKKK